MNDGKNYYNKQINHEEYVDIAVKNVLNYNAKVAEKEVFDLNKIKDMQIYLINQAESVCIGCGFINKKKKKFNVEELSEQEAELYEALKKYFKSKEEIFGANIDRLASKMLQQAVDGEYDSRVAWMRAKLDESIEKGEIDKQTANLQLANFKFQLILDAISSGKSRRADFEI